MAKSNMDQDILKVLLSEEEIKTRVAELGEEIYDAFRDKNPMFVGVLNGCFIFMADLVRAAQLKSELEFIGVSSYNNGTKSSGVVQITRDLQRDISGRDIIVVEDILDSGNTLAFLTDYLRTKGAASVTIATLLDKPARRENRIRHMKICQHLLQHALGLAVRIGNLSLRAVFCDRDEGRIAVNGSGGAENNLFYPMISHGIAEI